MNLFTNENSAFVMRNLSLSLSLYLNLSMITITVDVFLKQIAAHLSKATTLYNSATSSIHIVLIWTAELHDSATIT